MDLNKRINTTIVSISFSAFVLINIFIDRIGSTGNRALDIFLMLVLKVITFSLVSLVVSKMHKKYWSVKHKPLDVSGEWYHVHLIAGKDDYLRVGTVRIAQSYFYLSITGQNNSIKYDANKNKDGYEPLDATTTTWFENGIISEDTSTFEGTYTATRNFANGSIRKGIHTFTFYYNDKEKRPSKMYGSFYDVSPFNRSGSITMFRSKAERDRYVLDMCRANTNPSRKKTGPFISNLSEPQ